MLLKHGKSKSEYLSFERSEILQRGSKVFDFDASILIG